MGLEKIKVLMKIKGFNSEMLSKQCGVPKSTIDKIICGITPDPRYETVKAIANGLDLSIDELSEYLGIDTAESGRTSSYITDTEREHIWKYRALDEHGKELIDILIKKEYERCNSENKKAIDEFGFTSFEDLEIVPDPFPEKSAK